MDRPPPYQPSGSGSSYQSDRLGSGAHHDSAGKTDDSMRKSEPPSYSESAWQHRDQVELAQRARVQTVCSCVDEVQRRRELLGIMQTTLALVLPEQTGANTKWTLVGWPEDDMPHFRVLPDHAGSHAFWSQPEMQNDLQRLLGHGQISRKMAEIRVDDVFLRTETPFGLYETFAVKALIIKLAS